MEAVVKKVSLEDRSCVDIRDKGNEIIIKPKTKNTLSDMLRNITEKNIHGEVETNGPIGNEAW
jgi:antitoxin component of MazEF toxin-antitoxin module